MKKNYQHRDKFFWVTNQFKDYPYQDRRTIGINLNDFWHEDGMFRVEVEGGMYEIPSQKAIMLAKKFSMRSGTMPNLIPLPEFTCTKLPFPPAHKVEEHADAQRPLF